MTTGSDNFRIEWTDRLARIINLEFGDEMVVDMDQLDELCVLIEMVLTERNLPA